jgi:L-lactate dehydrogenase complex protein LldG
VSSKDIILERIKKALGPSVSSPLEIERAYRLETGTADLAALFEERVDDYRATVHRCAAHELPQVIAGILERLGVKRVAVPHDLEESWIPKDLERLIDRADSEPRGLEVVDAVVTGCATAIAETGTIVLDHAAGQGRRALTLIPDRHICVVFEHQIADNLPSAIMKLSASVRAGLPLTFISGPSATSDIELSRVEGVHGPRTLEVVIVASR